MGLQSVKQCFTERGEESCVYVYRYAEQDLQDSRCGRVQVPKWVNVTVLLTATCSHPNQMQSTPQGNHHPRKNRKKYQKHRTGSI